MIMTTVNTCIIHRSQTLLLDAKTNEDITLLANEESVIRLLGDAGCSALPLVSNQELLVQRLMLHTILSKRKVLLDHLSKVLKHQVSYRKQQKIHLLFESLFVASDESLTPEKAKDSLKFPGHMDEEQIQSMAYLLQFIDECSKEELKEFLRFTTGSTALPRSRKIKIEFDFPDGCIFASTCLMELHLPNKFDSFTSFKMALKTVISRDEKSFNAM